jgi:putative transposase
VVDFVNAWSERAELPQARFSSWLGVARGKLFDWRERYGKVNEHNSWVPRDHWLEEWEKRAIIDYYTGHPLEGYKRLAYMMLDEDVVAVSPSSVYRVLRGAGLMQRWNGKASKKGTGFNQPVKPHEHWHVDIAYVNCWGTFYYLFLVVDGYSRYIVHWDVRPSMTEADAEIILQRARELFPDAKPRVISDNGPQFIARDFKAFIRLCGMTHVRTSPYYPQSNGKVERVIKTVKAEGLRPASPRDLGEARRAVAGIVRRYNTERLHSSLGYVTPGDKLLGREGEIFAERDRKLEAARERRARVRAAERAPSCACAGEAVPA